MRNMIRKILLAICVVVYIGVVLFFTNLTLTRHLILTSPILLMFLFWKKSRPVTGVLLSVLILVPLFIIVFTIVLAIIAHGFQN